MKRTAACPICTAKIPAIRVLRNDAGRWALQFGERITKCPNCGEGLRHVSVSQSWTLPILVVVLSPLLAAGVACIVLAGRLGPIAFSLYVPALGLYGLLVLWQWPFTNGFVVRSGAADLRDQEAARQRRSARELKWAVLEEKYRDIGMALLIVCVAGLVILLARLIYTQPYG